MVQIFHHSHEETDTLNYVLLRNNKEKSIEPMHRLLC